MHLLILFIIYVILFYSIYKIIFLFKNKKQANDIHKVMEIHLLEHKYNIDINKIGINKIINLVCLCNAIIFAIVLISTIAIDNIFLRLLAMFGLLLPLTYLVYTNLGKYLKKRGK